MEDKNMIENRMFCLRLAKELVAGGSALVTAHTMMGSATVYDDVIKTADAFFNWIYQIESK